MYKIPVITITNVYDEDKVIGTQYLDDEIEVENVFDFINTVTELVTDESSIILYRQDIKRFALRIENDFEETGVFKQIKCNLRQNYTVFKLRHNPRTLEFYGINTAFIIHKLK